MECSPRKVMGLLYVVKIQLQTTRERLWLACFSESTWSEVLKVEKG